MNSATKETPLVSVVIPTRNRLVLLQRAIDSINSQTYQNIELIIIDNNSHVPIDLKKISTSFPTKILRNNEVISLPRNRNLGANSANGDFICFLDDDDSFTPIKIYEELQALLNDTELDYSYGETEQIDGNGRRITIGRGPNNITHYLRWRHIHVNALMVRKEVFLKTSFNTEMSTFEDVDFIGRLILFHKGIYIPNLHAIWNRDNRPDQMTNKNWRKSYENWKRLCNTFSFEIDSSISTRKFYHKKMFILSLLFFDIPQAIKSITRLY